MSGGIACVCAMCIEHVWKKCANKMLLLHFKMLCWLNLAQLCGVAHSDNFSSSWLHIYPSLLRTQKKKPRFWFNLDPLNSTMPPQLVPTIADDEWEFTLYSFKIMFTGKPRKVTMPFHQHACFVGALYACFGWANYVYMWSKP